MMNQNEEEEEEIFEEQEDENLKEEERGGSKKKDTAVMTRRDDAAASLKMVLGDATTEVQEEERLYALSTDHETRTTALPSATVQMGNYEHDPPRRVMPPPFVPPPQLSNIVLHHEDHHAPPTTPGARQSYNYHNHYDGFPSCISTNNRQYRDGNFLLHRHLRNLPPELFRFSSSSSSSSSSSLFLLHSCETEQEQPEEKCMAMRHHHHDRAGTRTTSPSMNVVRDVHGHNNRSNKTEEVLVYKHEDFNKKEKRGWRKDTYTRRRNNFQVLRIIEAALSVVHYSEPHRNDNQDDDEDDNRATGTQPKTK
jgi:hypothetical protein